MRRLFDARWIVASVAVLLGAALIVLTHHSINRTPSGPVLQTGDPGFDPIRADEIQTILPEDAIPAIVRPTYISAAAASDFGDTEQVIGVSINGDSRAFPISTLSAHEIVNDVIGGRPIAVTW